MQRFFVSQEMIDEENMRIRLTGEDVNHIKNVLRMKTGEELWVSDGERYEYHSQILEIGSDEILLEILYRQEPDYELPSKIWLFQGLPKGDKTELIIQKAVELGAYQIVPVRMKRCVMKLDEKRGAKKAERWKQIAESAAKQSRRMLVPQVSSPVSFAEAMQMAGALDRIIVPYELEKGMTETRNILDSIKPGESIGIFIGPEGGFDPQEIEELKSRGAETVTLGHRILRTETAGMTLLSVLMFKLETD